VVEDFSVGQRRDAGQELSVLPAEVQAVPAKKEVQE
jgi:hypothetical protein